MKTFIVYVPGHSSSELYANECLDSFSDKKGYGDVELFKGVTPSTLEEHVRCFFPKGISPIVNSRAWCFENLTQTKKDIHLTKKSCFMNHVRLWNNAIILDEPILFIEHDSICVRDFWLDISSLNFDVLILNIYSAYTKQKTLRHFQTEFGSFIKDKKENVIHPYDGAPLVYTKNTLFNRGYQIPGTAAYAVSPSGAKKLLESARKHGWEQSDYFINTKNVSIDFLIPELFTFNNRPNLELSHGLATNKGNTLS